MKYRTWIKRKENNIAVRDPLIDITNKKITLKATFFTMLNLLKSQLRHRVCFILN